MPTQLAQTARSTRLFFFGSIAAMIAYFFLSQIFGLTISYLNSLKPPPEIPPTVGFGKLPKLNFRSIKILGGNPQFELETTTGELPKMAKKLNVFQIVSPKASYLSLDRAKDLAKRLGFVTSPQTISSSIYFWEEEDRTLKMNIFTENFILESDLSKLIIPIGELPAIPDIQKEVSEYLSSKGLWKYGYEEGESKVVLGRIEEGKALKTDAPANASVARLTFFRFITDKETGDKIKILSPNPEDTVIQALIYSPKKNAEILRLKYNNWELEQDNSETYPAKTLTSAYQELIDGQATLSLVRERGTSSLDYPLEVELVSLTVRNIFLAYFDDESLQRFLQPIYVFEGDARDGEGKIYDFSAYVQAIDTSWIEP